MPDALFRRAKATAAMRGMSLKRLITQAVDRELNAAAASESRERHVKLPLVPSAKPGSVRLTPERAARLLEQEDLSAAP